MHTSSIFVSRLKSSSSVEWKGKDVRWSNLRTCSRSSSLMVDNCGTMEAMGMGAVDDSAATTTETRQSAAKPLPNWSSTLSRITSFCKSLNTENHIVAGKGTGYIHARWRKINSYSRERQHNMQKQCELDFNYDPISSADQLCYSPRC